MRYLVNGVETDLVASTLVDVAFLPDRLAVRTPTGTQTALVVVSGDKTLVSLAGRTFTVEKPSATRSAAKTHLAGELRSPMPGQVVDVFVEQGQKVQAGQKLLVLEAMKMQHAVPAPFDGTVVDLPAVKGDQVVEGQLLAHVEADHESKVSGSGI